MGFSGPSRIHALPLGRKNFWNFALLSGQKPLTNYFADFNLPIS